MRRAERVRGGEGPVFLELRTYRFRAHSMYDPDLYRDKDEIERWKQHDPIAAFTRAPAHDGSAEDAVAALEAESPPRSTTPSRFAEAGTLEPVERAHALRRRRGAP